MSALQAGNRSLYSPTRRSAVGLAAFAALAFAANSAIAQDIPASPQPHIHTPRSQKSFAMGATSRTMNSRTRKRIACSSGESIEATS